jgi:hypothetical protein
VRESLGYDLTIALSYEKGDRSPSPQSSPRRRGEADQATPIATEIWDPT